MASRWSCIDEGGGEGAAAIPFREPRDKSRRWNQASAYIDTGSCLDAGSTTAFHRGSKFSPIVQQQISNYEPGKGCDITPNEVKDSTDRQPLVTIKWPSLPVFIIKANETTLVNPNKAPVTEEEADQTEENAKQKRQTDKKKIGQSSLETPITRQSGEAKDQADAHSAHYEEQHSKAKDQPRGKGRNNLPNQGDNKAHHKTNAPTDAKNSVQHIPIAAGESGTPAEIIKSKKSRVETQTLPIKPVNEAAPATQTGFRQVESAMGNVINLWSITKLRYDPANRRLLRLRDNQADVEPSNTCSTASKNSSSSASVMGDDIYFDFEHRRIIRKRQSRHPVAAREHAPHPQLALWAGQAVMSPPPGWFPPHVFDGPRPFALPAVFPPSTPYPTHPFFPPWAPPPSSFAVAFSGREAEAQLPHISPPTKTAKSTAKAKHTKIPADASPHSPPSPGTADVGQSKKSQANASKSKKVGANAAPELGKPVRSKPSPEAEPIIIQDFQARAKTAESAKPASPQSATKLYSDLGQREPVLPPVVPPANIAPKTNAVGSKQSKKGSKHDKHRSALGPTAEVDKFDDQIHVPRSKSTAQKAVEVAVHVDKKLGSGVVRETKNSSAPSSISLSLTKFAPQASFSQTGHSPVNEGLQVPAKKASAVGTASVIPGASSFDVPAQSQNGSMQDIDASILQVASEKHSVHPITFPTSRVSRAKVKSQTRNDKDKSSDHDMSQASSKKHLGVSIVSDPPKFVSLESRKGPGKNADGASRSSSRHTLVVLNAPKSKSSSHCRRVDSHGDTDVVGDKPVKAAIKMVDAPGSYRSHHPKAPKSASPASAVGQSDATSRSTVSSKRSSAPSQASHRKSSTSKRPSSKVSTQSKPPSHHLTSHDPFFEIPKRSSGWHSNLNSPEIWISLPKTPAEVYNPTLPSLHPRDSASQISSASHHTASTRKSSKQSGASADNGKEMVLAAAEGSAQTRRSSNWRVPTVESLRSEGWSGGEERWVVEAGVRVRIVRTRTRTLGFQERDHIGGGQPEERFW